MRPIEVVWTTHRYFPFICEFLSRVKAAVCLCFLHFKRLADIDDPVEHAKHMLARIIGAERCSALAPPSLSIHFQLHHSSALIWLWLAFALISLIGWMNRIVWVACFHLIASFCIICVHSQPVKTMMSVIMVRNRVEEMFWRTSKLLC